MSLTIAINTASKESAIALFENGQLLGENSWISNANESIKLLPGLEQLLTEANKSWNDLTHVFVVKGPGAYTSLRVGITIANSIAWVNKLEMISTDVFEVWNHRIPENKRKDEHVIAIAAGKNRYLIRQYNQEGAVAEDELVEWETIENLGIPCYGESPQETPNLHQNDLKSFGEALASIGLDHLKLSDQVDPLYTRPPDITTRKKK